MPISEQEAALERLRHRFETRFEALERVTGAIAELREVTSPREMLSRAPAALCAGSAFDRAILSLVKGGRMVAEAAHFAGAERAAAATLAQLQANPLATRAHADRDRAAAPAPGHDRRRRGRASSGRPRDGAPHGVAVVRGRAARRRVAGRGRDPRRPGPGQPLDVLDRDVLWEFATGLAQAYESTSLRRTLRDERDQMRQFLDWLGARSSELTDAPVTLSAGGPRTPAPAARRFLRSRRRSGRATTASCSRVF